MSRPHPDLWRRLKGDCSLSPALPWVAFVWFSFSGSLPNSPGQKDVREEEIGGKVPWAGFAVSSEPAGLALSPLGTQ